MCPVVWSLRLWNNKLTFIEHEGYNLFEVSATYSIFLYYIMDNEVYIVVVANYSLISEPDYLFPNRRMFSVMLIKNMEQNVLINKDNIKFR